MPTNRRRRSRRRTSARLTDAELQWLTGKKQPGANRFELLLFKYLNDPARFAQAENALARAEGVVSAERIAELRKMIAKLRAEHQRRYPRHHHYTSNGKETTHE